MDAALISPNGVTARASMPTPPAARRAERKRSGVRPGTETLSFYARLKSQSVRVVPELLDRVGLTAVGRSRVGTYSKGMCQRLGLAQALLGHPPCAAAGRADKRTGSGGTQISTQSCVDCAMTARAS
jgi:hypothetical protein